MDDREKQRVLFHVKAALLYKGKEVEGDVENLSMNGMFINTDVKIPENEEADFSIHLSGSSSRLNLNIKGKIVRQEEKGLAVSFLEMDLDSYVHLKYIIELNRMDDDHIAEEFSNSDFS